MLSEQEKIALTTIATNGMVILKLPILEVKFDYYMLGANNAAININTSGARVLLLSTVLAKRTDTYADWYQLIAHELIHLRQIELGNLIVKVNECHPDVLWKGKSCWEMFQKAKDSDEDIYSILPWEQEANLEQETIGMMLQREIGIAI